MKSRGFYYYVEQTDSCWNWKGGKNQKGYGRFQYGGKQVQAHRHILTELGYEIPIGFQVDHLCRNPSCVNPQHLDIVTPKENIRRGNNHVADKINSTHCVNNHPLSGENLYVTSLGHRVCKTCRRDNLRRFKDKK